MYLLKGEIFIMKKPLLLMILDGFGIAEEKGNAIKSANTPNIDKIFSNNPITQIGASGMDVGLPGGQMGNSEVGHTNIGAGRVVYQELTRISKAIEDESFFENEAINNAIDKAIENGTSLHIMGLLSDGGVHSHKDHLYALLELAKRKGLEKVYIHAMLDGRDTPPTSAKEYLEECQNKIAEIGVGKIATIMGRYYSMDRDNRFERVEKAYSAMVYGIGLRCYNPIEAVEKSYASKVTDEFVVPTICTLGAKIKPNDSVIFFNFRPDRAREITRSLVDPKFSGFKRKLGFFPLNYVCMTQYDETLPNVSVAFKPQTLKNTFGEYISNKGLTQLRIAETEKYAHVTFFFNGGIEESYPGEDRVLIHSPKVATYDLQPEMSAYEVTDNLVQRIESGKYDVIILNYANCDMVGHTGVFEAAVKAVEAVDTCIGRVIEAMEKVGGITLITADHGNADKMVAENGSPFTAHTTNPVPFCVVGYDCVLNKGGRLCDIAPTMLQILDLPKPEEMDGQSLIASHSPINGDKKIDDNKVEPENRTHEEGVQDTEPLNTENNEKTADQSIESESVSHEEDIQNAESLSTDDNEEPTDQSTDSDSKAETSSNDMPEINDNNSMEVSKELIDESNIPKKLVPRKKRKHQSNK